MEITGRVTAVQGDQVSVQLDADVFMAVGSYMEVLRLENDNIVIMAGRITLSSGSRSILGKMDAGAAKPQAGNSVRLIAGASKSAPGSTGINPSPNKTTFNFDALNPGKFATDTFISQGVRFAREKGEALIMDVEPNMVVAGDHRHVLLLGGGERVTALTVQFDQPLQRVSITRIGTRGGASVPTRTLKAFDSRGQVVSFTGETHWLPKEPKAFSLTGQGIVKILLETDNRFGNGAWATWSSLPLVEMEIQR